MYNKNEIINDFKELKVRNKTWTLVWEPFLRKYKCDYICELGVSTGANFYEMIKSNPKVAIAIDSWVDDGEVSRNDVEHPQETLNKQYEDFKKEVTDKQFVKLYREYTFDAVKHFKDNYFDLVYVDADHSYEGCLRDIEDWYPKVKKGKLLLGDDYRIYEGKHIGVKFGVIEAVNEFAKKNGLDFFELQNHRKRGWGIIKR